MVKVAKWMAIRWHLEIVLRPTIGVWWATFWLIISCERTKLPAKIATLQLWPSFHARTNPSHWPSLRFGSLLSLIGSVDWLANYRWQSNVSMAKSGRRCHWEPLSVLFNFFFFVKWNIIEIGKARHCSVKHWQISWLPKGLICIFRRLIGSSVSAICSR